MIHKKQKNKMIKIKIYQKIKNININMFNMFQIKDLIYNTMILILIQVMINNKPI